VFGSDEIVSIGTGGHLTVRFGTPILDDPSNPYGVDLIVFGNNGFIDAAFPAGTTGPSGTLFDGDTMQIELSGDGVNFVALGSFLEGFIPTRGYADSDPYDAVPGSSPTDFLTPMDPALTPSDFGGLTFAQLNALYGESGGGTPIDIASSGLSSVTHVRVSNPLAGQTIEIDAFARVPAPASAFGLALYGLAASRRRR